jgi:hypothetical protein
MSPDNVVTAPAGRTGRAMEETTVTAQSLPATRLLDDVAAPTPRPAVLGRRTAVAALLVGATLNLAEALLGRVVGVGGSPEQTLDAVAARPGLAATTLAVGTLAVPFLLLGLVAMAQLIKPRMPRLGTAAAVSGFVGALGFLGLHAVSIVDAAAAEQPDRAAMLTLLQDVQSSPLALLVLVPFLIGMPLSVLLSSIGMFRTRAVHRWIPAVLVLFLVLDFGQFPTGPVDPHWLFVAAAFGVAAAIARRTDREWWLGTADTEKTGN